MARDTGWAVWNVAVPRTAGSMVKLTCRMRPRIWLTTSRMSVSAKSSEMSAAAFSIVVPGLSVTGGWLISVWAGAIASVLPTAPLTRGAAPTLPAGWASGAGSGRMSGTGARAHDPRAAASSRAATRRTRAGGERVMRGPVPTRAPRLAQTRRVAAG